MAGLAFCRLKLPENDSLSQMNGRLSVSLKAPELCQSLTESRRRTQKNLEPPWPGNLACVLSKIKKMIQSQHPGHRRRYDIVTIHD